MNHLQHESSPYLLQHAHNPVDWYAWKPEAFERARAEQKPILVSIGYSTCHWCHVMERESFENEDIAAFMNEHFINIKVDREERPDVDAIYMEACQLLTGSGGWPLNCFLTPDAKPFYAGTYFPPRPAHNRPAWLQLLQHLADIWETKRDTATEQADRLLANIQRNDGIFISALNPSTPQPLNLQPLNFEALFSRMRAQFDHSEGGFGGAPKFPSTMALQWLLNWHYFSGNPEALQHAIFSLDKMARGGIYDQIGGGFARYATDREWLVPHFEKMLYDNALLVSVLSEAHKIVESSQQSTVNSQRSTVTGQQSTVNSQRSTVNSQQSTVNSQQSSNKPSLTSPVR
ncbi:MAG: thioredoxin domain-containing protein [Phycisphaerae bacterium]|nr:thioredoxin domain-containing protein [Saprospiraceae bacterium]